jgi:hypothetical protein
MQTHASERSPQFGNVLGDMTHLDEGSEDNFKEKPDDWASAVM